MIEGYDLKELNLRRKGEVLAEIPDSFYAKKYLPLCDNVFTAIRLQENWKVYQKRYEDVEEMIAKNLKIEFDEMMEATKAARDGKIKRLKETIVRWGYPPTLPIRTDMADMSTKMIYGSSTDISFACISDMDRDLIFIFNLHVEESVPEGYFFVLKGEDPEIFERRHMKLGIRLCDLGKKIKSNLEVARRMREILIDIRNERTPEWANSTYHIAIYFTASGSNLSMEFSNWNALGDIWDGVNAMQYGLPDCMFNYEPLPPILEIMFGLNRQLFTERLVKTLTEHKMYWNYMNIDNLKEYKVKDYETYDYFIRFYSHQLENGIPLPVHSLNSITPIYNKKTGKWETMGITFPEGPRIHYNRDLGLTFEEALNGVLFDITHESKIDKVTRDNIISLGYGLGTTYLRPEEE
ncbi:MAG: hypothetical protein HWN65_04085 [Candidatus Helarchaeota archaeon]|nr:hypothetical protein [Candidatus Helarchaeota archaeon]